MCLSLPTRIAWKPHVQISPNFLCVLPDAMTLSSSDGVVIFYVLPVICTTSFMPWDHRQNQAWHCLEEFARWRNQLDLRQLWCLVEFVRLRHWGKVYYLQYPCSKMQWRLLNHACPTWTYVCKALCLTVICPDQNNVRHNFKEKSHRFCFQNCNWEHYERTGKCAFCLIC